MNKIQNQFIWMEAYRPTRIDECILPDSLLKTFQEFAENGDIPNLILAGPSGSGKTTIARALCEELETDYMIINGSEESGIDVLRTKIRDFASTISLQGKRKVVIIDEADYLNPNSTQPALRGFIEEFSKSCRFIFTCNFKNKIIQPLHSRTTVIEFRLSKEEKPKMAARFMKRVVQILKNEGIVFDEKVVAQVLKKHFPDYRRILNELQRHSSSGSIGVEILANTSDLSTREFLSFMREKDFNKMRSWVVNNMDNDPSAMFRFFDEALISEVDNPAQLIVILADYSYKSAFCSDTEINYAACLTEIMSVCQIK